MEISCLVEHHCDPGCRVHAPQMNPSSIFTQRSSRWDSYLLLSLSHQLCPHIHSAPPPPCLPAAVSVATVMAVIMLQLGHLVLGRGNKGFPIIRYCSQKAFQCWRSSAPMTKRCTWQRTPGTHLWVHNFTLSHTYTRPPTFMGETLEYPLVAGCSKDHKSRGIHYMM